VSSMLSACAVAATNPAATTAPVRIFLLIINSFAVLAGSRCLRFHLLFAGLRDTGWVHPRFTFTTDRKV
jgi:formate-dependent nitrite reductase membrane component NrfD